MTGFEKYISTIFHCTELHKHMGSGRLLMKVLHELHPHLFWRVVDVEDLDPRCDVANQPAFIDFLINNWDKYEKWEEDNA